MQDEMNDLQQPYTDQNPDDLVRVVRCRECKYYVIHSLFGHSQGWCERLCDEFDRSLAHGTEKDDYCSHGEKRDGMDS